MSRLVVVICFLITLTSLAQKKKVIYLDESYVEISKKQHKKKLNSNLYHSLNYDLDTVLYKKLRLNRFFGKIDKVKKQQFFNFLSARNKIDTTKTMVFHYSDTLKRKNQFRKSDTVVYMPNNRHRHLISYKTFLNQHKNCIAKHNKYPNTQVLHYYNVNAGHPDKVGGVKWYKDSSSMIKRLFSDRYKNFKYFILRPDGSYFVFNVREYKDFNYDDLLNGNWEKIKNKFIKKYTRLNK